MVTQKSEKAKPKGLTNYRAAQLLNVTASHLWKVRHGKRVSHKLMRRLAELEAKEAAK